MSKRQNTRVRTTVLRHVSRNAQPVHVATVTLYVDGEAQFAESLTVRHYLDANGYPTGTRYIDSNYIERDSLPEGAVVGRWGSHPFAHLPIDPAGTVILSA